MVFSGLVFKNFEIGNIIFYLLESITFGALINLVVLPFKSNKISKILKCFILIGITVIYIAQFVHYNFYDCFFSTYSLVNSGQVFGFMDAIMKVIMSHIVDIIMFIIMLVLVCVCLFKHEDEDVKRKPLVLVVVMLISLFITFGLTLLDNNNLYSRKNLIFKTNSMTENTKSFGLITSSLIDIDRYVFLGEEQIVTNEKTNNKVYSKKNYNIDDIDFASLEKSEKDFKKRQIHAYFKTVRPTDKNEYTGVLKGKNLIFITAESFNFNILDKKLTPTLYKMSNEGLKFTNFYTPIYYASTSDGEYTNLTGLIPREGTWSYLSSIGNEFPYSYANVFEKENYKTYSYHNGVYDFYKRNEAMPSFGFDSYLGCGNGLENKINCKLWPQSDDEMFRGTFEDYKKDKHFVTYYMTISAHLSHNFKNNDMAKKHEKQMENSSYSEAVRAYLSASIDLDKALSNLLESLSKNNILKDTVIVLVPDHYPYGLSENELKEFEDLKNPYDKYKTGLIIYNEDLEQKEITKYASNLDILPTLLNMYGVEYNSKAIIGKDIMSNDDGIVMFNDRSFLTDKGYYSEKEEKFYGFSKVSDKYIKDKQIEVFNKTNISSMILETNYYKSLK